MRRERKHLPLRPSSSRREARFVLGPRLAIWLALFPLLLFPNAARADYRLCNATGYVLAGAIGFQDDPAYPRSEWRTRGWVRMVPGACASVLEGPVRGGSYFVFARSIEAHQGPTKYFSGDQSFCSLPENFAIAGRDSCALRGYDTSEFIRVETKAGEEWTTTFGEPRDYSLDQARIAGVQRLLRDNGFRVARIDGYAAKATRRSVMAFQRAKGLEATGTIDDALVTALIEGAELEQAGAGLDICNRTRHLAWAAVGFRAEDEDVSSGWIRIAPGRCAKAVKGKLAATPYFLYAEATDGKGAVARERGRALVWSGKEPYCTKATRFEIRGREACARRGYDERNFMRVDAGGRAHVEVPLE